MKAFTSKKQQWRHAPDGGEHSTKRRRRKKSPDGAGEKRPEDGSLGVLDHQQGRGALTLVLIQSGYNALCSPPLQLGVEFFLKVIA